MKDTSLNSPLTVQDLLLRATFRSNDSGTDAWRAWKSTVDLDNHLDLGSYRLLPELARRLRQQGIEDPLLDRFAGVSRKHWLANRLFFRELSAPVRVLRARDVRVMVPAEVTLGLQHYADYPLDPLVNGEIVVLTERARAAVEALDASGWIPTPRIRNSLLDHYISAKSWHPFRGPGGARLRLHWHVLPQRATQAVDRDYWSRGTEVGIGDETVVALSGTDQLVQLCARRIGMQLAPRFQRAVDVMMLLNACPREIDWQRFLEESAKPGLVLPIQETFRYLNDHLDDAVPPLTFERIRRHPVSKLERVEHAVNRRWNRGLGGVVGLWLDYRRSRSTNFLTSAVGFPRFLQHFLRLAHIWQVPVRVVARAVDDWRESIRGTATAPREVTDAVVPGK